MESRAAPPQFPGLSGCTARSLHYRRDEIKSEGETIRMREVANNFAQLLAVIVGLVTVAVSLGALSQLVG